MPRPRKKRSVHRPPLFTEFKPAGVPSRELETLELALDEFEALRLADYLGLDHAESADQMEISRPTFSRLIESARAKVARLLVEGKHLRIDGGDIHFRGNLIRCHECGHMFTTSIDDELGHCPNCGSARLIDLAGGFGHGQCCRRHQRRQGR